jgi:hypothetical protein
MRLVLLGRKRSLAAILSPLSREAGDPRSAYKETHHSLAAKEDTMKRKAQFDDARRQDERVTAMLERHVRGRHGAAAIRTHSDATLRKRLEIAR